MTIIFLSKICEENAWSWSLKILNVGAEAAEKLTTGSSVSQHVQLNLPVDSGDGWESH
jgi:hypothetical protein